MAGSKRERDLHRAKIARQEREAAAARESRRRWVQIGAAVTSAILVLAIVGGVALAVSSNDDDEPSAAAPSAIPSSTAEVGDVAKVKCKKPTDAKPKSLSYDTIDSKLIPDAKYVETLTTNCGTIAFTMDAEKAPKTTAQMAFLSDRDGYFNNTMCHRLTTDGIYVLQCGDPKGDGTGGPGVQIAEENLPAAGADGTAVYPRGTVAMANAGAGTTGSQFFLVYKDSPLPPNYTVLGQITEGLEIVDKVAAAGVEGGGTDGTPVQPLQITKMVSSATFAAS